MTKVFFSQTPKLAHKKVSLKKLNDPLNLGRYHFKPFVTDNNDRSQFLHKTISDKSAHPHIFLITAEFFCLIYE